MRYKCYSRIKKLSVTAWQTESYRDSSKDRGGRNKTPHRRVISCICVSHVGFTTAGPLKETSSRPWLLAPLQGSHQHGFHITSEHSDTEVTFFRKDNSGERCSILVSTTRPHEVRQQHLFCPGAEPSLRGHGRAVSQFLT